MANIVPAKAKPTPRRIGTFRIHPFAEKVSRLTERETYQAIKRSIKKDGFDESQPIIVANGQVIDGVLRLLACNELNIDPLITTIKLAADEVVDFIARRNIRRELSKWQRCELALTAFEHEQEQAGKRERSGATVDVQEKGETFEIIAKPWGISASTLKRYAALPNSDKQKVKRGTKTINAAWKDNSNPPVALPEGLKDALQREKEQERIEKKNRKIAFGEPSSWQYLLHDPEQLPNPYFKISHKAAQLVREWRTKKKQPLDQALAELQFALEAIAGPFTDEKRDTAGLEKIPARKYVDASSEIDYSPIAPKEEGGATSVKDSPQIAAENKRLTSEIKRLTEENNEFRNSKGGSIVEMRKTIVALTKENEELKARRKKLDLTAARKEIASDLIRLEKENAKLKKELKALEEEFQLFKKRNETDSEVDFDQVRADALASKNASNSVK